MDPGGPAASRADLVIASNRLPFTLVLADGALELEPSAGGLVTALDPVRAKAALGRVARARRPGRSRGGGRAGGRRREAACPVFLSEAEQEAFYGRICNETLWPLFHYFVDRMRFTSRGLGRLRGGEPALRRGNRPRQRAGGPGLDPRLPSGARAAGASPAAARSCDRLLPPHPVPLVGDLPAAADEGRAAAGDARLRLRRLPHRRLCPSFPLRPACACSASSPARTRSNTTTARSASACTRSGSTSRASARACETRRRRRSRPSSTSATATASSSSGSSGSTTRRGSRRSSTPSSASSSRTRRAPSGVTMLQVLVPSRLESAEYRAMRDEIEMRIAHINGRFSRLGHAPGRLRPPVASRGPSSSRSTGGPT